VRKKSVRRRRRKPGMETLVISKAMRKTLEKAIAKLDASNREFSRLLRLLERKWGRTNRRSS
jgi:hypothetical protein